MKNDKKSKVDKLQEMLDKLPPEKLEEMDRFTKWLDENPWFDLWFTLGLLLACLTLLMSIVYRYWLR